MKKILALTLAAALLLTGCGKGVEPTPTETQSIPTEPPAVTEAVAEITGDIVDILLDGQNITVTGDGSGVYTSRDIIYYENKTEYPSGNPYGDGESWEMHSREEAEGHLVVNITAPGSYRLSGKLDKGQIRIDLGQDAKEDPNAVVNLILDGAEITCTVAPAIVFRNVYECDGNGSEKKASPNVDTTAAGANLILAENSKNLLAGSHVAKIYKDQKDEKKLWKQDGAVYSYMSLNIYGPGALEIQADSEGLDTEKHLTIFGGDITIRSGNDGINTNEEGVSVTAIRGGTLRILAGLGEEGDGIDSNGYLVIYGGTVISSANPQGDAGLDSDLGTFIHGGTVIAMGSDMDPVDPGSTQVTMYLQFFREQSGNIRITGEDGTEVFSFDPALDPLLGENPRSFRGLILSCPQFRLGEGCLVFVDGRQMAYTGTAAMGDSGSFAPGEGGQRPEGGIGIPEDRNDMPEPPEGDVTIPPQPPEGGTAVPQGEVTNPPQGQGKTLFVLQDTVNIFFGLTPVE